MIYFCHMKIGILYLCTGKYNIFWKDFYESVESLLLPGCDKEYFVFTDAVQIEYEQKENVHKIFQEATDWPYSTLLRFHIFIKAETQLMEMNYIFFFNANMKIVSSISPEELLPDPTTEDGLTGVLHSGYYKATSNQLPYERKQKKSASYMKNGRYYFQGCLSGGTRDAYLKLIKELKQNIQTDLDNKIIAIWHDESHLNKYMADKNPKILSPAYSYPEGKIFDFQAKILMLDKKKLGGHNLLRNQKEGVLKKIKLAIKKVVK
jgi:Glycosyltransferase family 6